MQRNREGQKGSYIHTTLRSIVYQRIILEMSQYTKYLEKMQMIDTTRQTEKFSEAAILKLTQGIMDNIVKPSFPLLFLKALEICSPNILFLLAYKRQKVHRLLSGDSLDSK